MKKSLIYATFSLLILSFAALSCGKSSKAYKDLQKDYDSVSSEYHKQISEMDSIIGLVINNFREINAMEGMIDVDKLQGGDIEKSRKSQIEDNVKMINERLRSNREEIEKLNKKLKSSNQYAGGLKKTIIALENQLQEKTKEVLQLTEELKKKDMAISMLDSMVTDLNQTVTQNAQAIAQQNQTIAHQDAAINTVRYCVGTMNDLKEMNIVKNNKVATENYNPGYFSQVDKRTFNDLALYSKRAELLTNHPANSYKLVKGEDKMLTLHIINADDFWSLSKILVVRTY